jgi:two-component sensor histidine kinase
LLSLRSYDLPARLAPAAPRWMGETLVALACLACAGVIRLALDALTPGLPPFILLLPLVLLATVTGGWRPALASLAVSELWTWLYVIPPRGVMSKGGALLGELGEATVAALFAIGVVQVFRSLAGREAEAGAAKLAERDLMLRELEHRMKNNFQTVASLLELQLRRARDESAREALRQALGRVISVSQAHQSLQAAGGAGSVDMGIYLKDLCGSLAEALFLGELIRLECQVESGLLDRDRAVAVGLIVNELVTNAAKHAFPEGRSGQIRVAFIRRAAGYRLVVEDDGCGLPADFATSRQGLGRGLVEAFARQAGGSINIGQGPGARFEVDLVA